MDYIDYYKILGIHKNATAEEIKKAYRKLARQHHPDLNPEDREAEELFQQINEANEVLSDPEKRKKYDQYGKDWKQADQYEASGAQQRPSGAQAGDAPFEEGNHPFGDGGDFSDFFASMFGDRGNGNRHIKFRGQDFHASFQLNLSETYRTHKQRFTVNGKNIRITVPAGIENGQEIKLPGYGGPGINGGPSGDLYITFEIKNDTAFTRKGNDLYKMVPLNLYKAILGGEETIETLSGKVKMKIPPETQNGTKVRLKGKGFPLYKKEGIFGDLYITYQVQIPTHLTAKEKDLFEQLANER
ncbi:DnaJ C-terminal domain-containing protein [Parapedobacter sp.]